MQVCEKSQIDNKNVRHTLSPPWRGHIYLLWIGSLEVNSAWPPPGKWTKAGGGCRLDSFQRPSVSLRHTHILFELILTYSLASKTAAPWSCKMTAANIYMTSDQVGIKLDTNLTATHAPHWFIYFELRAKVRLWPQYFSMFLFLCLLPLSALPPLPTLCVCMCVCVSLFYRGSITHLLHLISCLTSCQCTHQHTILPKSFRVLLIPSASCCPVLLLFHSPCCMPAMPELLGGFFLEILD